MLENRKELLDKIGQLSYGSVNFFKRLLSMEKKYKDYFDFIKTMLTLDSDGNEESIVTLDVKMKMIKEQTKMLLERELTDYANEMTEQHNKYVEKLRTKML